MRGVGGETPLPLERALQTPQHRIDDATQTPELVALRLRRAGAPPGFALECDLSSRPRSSTGRRARLVSAIPPTPVSKSAAGMSSKQGCGDAPVGDRDEINDRRYLNDRASSTASDARRNHL